jgi:hypothetical protein
MNFDANRMLKLAGLPESGGNGLLKESRLHEEEAPPEEEKKVDQAALKDAVKQLATALGMEIKEPEGGEAASGEEGGEAGGDMAGLFGATSEGVSYSKMKSIIRDELASNWASGQVFGKKTGASRGVTMGFKGIGFK